MTSATMTRSHSGGGLLLLLVAAGLVLMITASYHAITTHGLAAVSAQDCFNGGGQVMQQVLEDPLSGRRMTFCRQNRQWFVSIDEPDGGNVTMFPRSWAKSLRDVIEYAHRSGFTTCIR